MQVWTAELRPNVSTGHLPCSSIGAGHAVFFHCKCIIPQVCGEEERILQELLDSGSTQHPLLCLRQTCEVGPPRHHHSRRVCAHMPQGRQCLPGMLTRLQANRLTCLGTACETVRILHCIRSACDQSRDLSKNSEMLAYVLITTSHLLLLLLLRQVGESEVAVP